MRFEHVVRRTSAIIDKPRGANYFSTCAVHMAQAMEFALNRPWGR
jgi:hypothetical protein